MRIPASAIVLGLLGTFWVSPTAAQGFGFELNGGLNLSDTFGDAVQSSSTHTGLTAGGALTLLTLGPVSVGAALTRPRAPAGRTSATRRSR